ncbi:MAG TPA: hypothetical protein VMW89_11285 [Desulfatiglandales bacterium]|nr:hypothetical protein [Desulfatiglandales bacterium]
MPAPARWDETPLGRGHEGLYPATVGRICICDTPIGLWYDLGKMTDPVLTKKPIKIDRNRFF